MCLRKIDFYGVSFMEYKQFRDFRKNFYQELKKTTRTRKIKLSAEQDIYKKDSPYFYNVWYQLEEVENGEAVFILDISIKYHRFDELYYQILRPEKEFHFTDKLRANSGMLCPAKFPRMKKSFKCDGSENSIPELCEDLLEFINKFYADFLSEIKEKYNDLNGYYIANKEKDPLLAGLAYLDRGDTDKAAECFASPDVAGDNSLWSVTVYTDEQRRRAMENGKQITIYNSIYRSRKEQFNDYAIALKNNIIWNNDRAMYGLLNEEKNIANNL